MALYHSPRIVRDGLVLHLDAANPKSYSGSGTTWYDLSGNGNDGTLVGGVTYDSSNNGNLLFDGVNDRVKVSSVTIGDNAEFSVDIWYQRGAQQDKYLYSESNPELSNNPFWGITSHTSSGTSMNLRIYARTDSGSAEQNFQSSGAEYVVYDDVNHNMVVVFQSDTLYFYVDGSAIGSTGWIKGSYSGLSEANIGGWRIVNSTGGHMNGVVYSTKLYNRALSSTEVASNFNALRDRYGL